MFKPQRFNGSVGSPWIGTNGYFYDPTGAAGQRLGISFFLSVGRFITDPTEAKAYADFSQTGTIGAANKGNNSKGGSIGESVDEAHDFNFGDDHGCEWDLNIQDTEVFYWTLMFKFNLHQNYLDSLHPAQ